VLEQLSKSDRGIGQRHRHFKNLRCHLEFRKMSAPRLLLTMARHAEAIGASSSGHLGSLNFPKGDDTLAQIHRQVADAFEVVGDFESGDNEPHLIVRKRSAAEQADSVFINNNFHFVDARSSRNTSLGRAVVLGLSRLTIGIERAIMAPSTVRPWKPDSSRAYRKARLP